MSPGGLGVKMVERLDSPSAIHARQSDMPWPGTPCVSLGSRDGVLDWESCEFDHHKVLMFFYLVKKALRISPHGKDAWPLGLPDSHPLSGSCILCVGQRVPVPAPHSPGPGPRPSTPHN